MVRVRVFPNANLVRRRSRAAGPGSLGRVSWGAAAVASPPGVRVRVGIRATDEGRGRVKVGGEEVAAASHHLPCQLQRVRLVVSQVVAHAGDRAVHLTAAQLLCGDLG